MSRLLGAIFMILISFILLNNSGLSRRSTAGPYNNSINGFSAAKRLALKAQPTPLSSFYCGCSIKNLIPDHASCGYEPYSLTELRAYKIEWEHLVPAYNFGRSFKAWRDGHPDCVTNSGRVYKGRHCARKVSQKFRYMEGDLHNLVPAIGELNKLRSNSPPGQVKESWYPLGGCSTKISLHSIEPRIEARGFLARAYLYMEHAYPGQGILSRKNSRLMHHWNRLYPPEDLEIERNKKIKKIQGNTNVFVEDYAKHRAP